MKEHPLVLTIEEVAIAMGISRTQAYAAAHSGEIPTIRIGKLFRVPRASLEKLMERASQGAFVKQEQMPIKQLSPKPATEISHVLYNRIPQRLFSQLAQAATENNCTIAAEVRRRLEASFESIELERWPS